MDEQTKQDCKDYPRLAKLGLEVHHTEESCPFVKHKDLKSNFQINGFWNAWCRWAVAITTSIHGIYPWDIEAFLSGKPNND